MAHLHLVAEEGEAGAGAVVGEVEVVEPPGQGVQACCGGAHRALHSHEFLKIYLINAPCRVSIESPITIESFHKILIFCFRASVSAKPLLLKPFSSSSDISYFLAPSSDHINYSLQCTSSVIMKVRNKIPLVTSYIVILNSRHSNIIT